MLDKKKLLGEYHVGKTIGEGAFSKVKLGYHKETNQKVAIKVIDKRMIEEKAEKAKEEQEHADKVKRRKELQAGGKMNLKNEAEAEHNQPLVPSFIASLQLEVQLLMRLNHPNVIRLYQVMETDDECYVVMEYASGGELLDHLTSKGKLNEKEARKYFRQLVSAMDHCHLANVVHRDLKLENLLLNASNDLLISDFGLGRTFSNDKTDLMKTFCGTPNYAAVELISGIPYVGVKSDIWAMGVVLFILASGDPPFYGSNINSLYSKIKAVEYKCPEYFSKDLKRLISVMLVKDPNKRITMDELRENAWVNFEEATPPTRILPKVVGNSDVSQISQFIAGITKDKNDIVYTLHKHTDDRNPDPQPSSPMAKFSRIISKKSNPKLDENDDEDTFTPLGDQEPKSPAIAVGRRKSNAADLFRRRGSSAAPSPVPQPRARASSIVPGGMSIPIAPADRPTQILRRMSSVGPALKVHPPTLPEKIVSADGTIIQPAHLSARRASSAVKATPSAVAPSSKAGSKPTGGKLVRSPSQIVDDPDPFAVEEGIMEQMANVTTAEIVDWHAFHRPPNEIRTVRFSFSPSTTSALPPAIIFRELHRVLLQTQEFVKSLKIKRLEEYYMVHCVTAEYGEDPIQFEVEICKVWMLKIHGLRFKRLAGDPFSYKKLYQNITEQLDLK